MFPSTSCYRYALHLSESQAMDLVCDTHASRGLGHFLCRMIRRHLDRKDSAGIFSP